MGSIEEFKRKRKVQENILDKEDDTLHNENESLIGKNDPEDEQDWLAENW